MSYLDGAGSRRGPAQFPQRSNVGASSSAAAAGVERADEAVSSGAAQAFAPLQGAQIAQPPPLVVGPVPVSFTLTDQPIDRVRRQIEDLGYKVANLTTTEDTVNGVQARQVRCDISIEADSPPYLLMPEKLYAQISEAVAGTELEQALLKDDVRTFTSSLFRATSRVYSQVGPIVRAPHLPPLEHPIDAYPRMQQDLSWCMLTRLVGPIYAALESDAQLPAEQRLAPERRSLLHATAQEIELGYSFIQPFFNAHHQLRPNPTFFRICLDHGYPAALRIACHHRATAESPAWRFMFPDLSPLPAEYSGAFDEYSRTAREYGFAREDNPSLADWFDNARNQLGPTSSSKLRNFVNAVAATPMKHASDKIRQDQRLCDKLIELMQAKIELAQARLRSLGSQGLAADSVQRFNEISSALDQAESSASSLQRLKSNLQKAERSPSVQSYLEAHDYVTGLDYVPALVVIEDLVQHGQNHEHELAGLHQRLSDPDLTDEERAQVHREIAALGGRDFAMNQMLSALESLRRSPQMADFMTSPDPERTMQLAHTAWTVAHETGFGSDAQHTFDAVLFWLRIADDDRFTHGLQAFETENAATASMGSVQERADTACRALEAYVDLLKKRRADPELAQQHPDVGAQMEDFRELMKNIRGAVAPPPEP